MWFEVQLQGVAGGGVVQLQGVGWGGGVGTGDSAREGWLTQLIAITLTMRSVFQ